MIINVPVTIFSKKHLNFEYRQSIDDDVLTLTASDELYQILCSNAKASEIDLPDDYDCVLVDISSRLASFVNIAGLSKTPIRLDKIHKKAMCKDVALLIEITDMEIQDALKTWLQARNIEEDDYSLESAVKYFYRFRRKKLGHKQDFFRRYKTNFVLSNGEKMQTKQTLIFDIKALDALIKIYIEKYPIHFTSARGLPLKKIAIQLGIYVYRNIGNYPPQYITFRFGVSDRVGRYCKKSFEQFLKRHPSMKNPREFINVIP